MKKLIITLLMVVAMMPAMWAQQKHPGGAERAAWMKEMVQYKHEYLTKELGLSAEQQKQFFAVYDAMDAEQRKLGEEMRRMVEEVSKKGDKATDLELTKAAEAQFEMRGRENAIEMRYFPKFKAILTPEQLFKLKKTEMKFNRMIIKEHQNRRKASKKAQR